MRKIPLAISIATALALFGKAKRTQPHQWHDDPNQLPFSPIGRFLEIQTAFASKDVTALRAQLGPNLIDQMLADLPIEPSIPKFRAVTYRVINATGKLLSIQYSADDMTDGTKVNKTWHFRRMSFGWVLDGIEQ